MQIAPPPKNSFLTILKDSSLHGERGKRGGPFTMDRPNVSQFRVLDHIDVNLFGERAFRHALTLASQEFSDYANLSLFHELCTDFQKTLQRHESRPYQACFIPFLLRASHTCLECSKMAIAKLHVCCRTSAMSLTKARAASYF